MSDHHREPDSPHSPHGEPDGEHGEHSEEHSGHDEQHHREHHQGDAPRRGAADDAGKQQPKQPHAGNGIVNDSPDERSPEGLGSDELALRRLLHEAVEDVEPRDGTLDHLRRAVPARRARKRQAAVGMAAAALFLGTAIPALVHVTGSTGPNADPSIAGHGSAAQGGTSEGKGENGGRSEGGTGGGGTGGGDHGGAEPEDHDTGDTKGTGSGGTTDPSGGASAVDDACTAEQLSVSGSFGAPDSMGAVYGSFRVTNVSAEGCTVVGSGEVTPYPLGTTDPARIGLARHVAGDAALSLPDPSLERHEVVLVPGAAYEVKFAWVPSETCPTDGGTGTGGTGTGGGDSGGTTGGGGDTGTTTGGGETGGATPTPTPTPSDGTTGTSDGTETGGDTGMTTQLVTEDGSADGGVNVTYTTELGAPSTSVSVLPACAGTVYRTGMIPQ
ncbi:hypothetical protein [Streptomyces sp. NPDC053367]|uniref:hypothetical protein n=1 Tax=Streptomyces sp. NPDC053367 TaxID=3365700 RepID=UPI0037CE921E